MQASSAPLQPSVRWSFQVFSNLSLEQPVQFKHATMQPGSGHFAQTKLKVRVLAWNAWNVSPVNPVSFFLKTSGKSSPKWHSSIYLHPQSLFLDGFFHVDFGSRRSSRRRSRRRSRRSSRWSCFRLLLGDAKKTSSSWWFGRNRIEIPRALKVVLVNPNYSKLVKHFIATWQYHGAQNFETFWDFMNGFGRKKTPEKIGSFTASVMSFSMTFKSASCCANKREAFLLGISNGQHSTSPNHWLGVAYTKLTCWYPLQAIITKKSSVG